MSIRLIKAQYLKPGDILTWNSGFYDYVNIVEKTRDNEIVIVSNGDTKPIVLEENKIVRILKKRV